MKKLLTIILLGLAITSQACWFTSADWQAVWIDRINNTSVAPTGSWGAITAPEAGTINIPATVYIKVTPSTTNAISIDEVRLQWKYSTSTTWTTINVIKDVTWTINYSKPLAFFGKYNLNPAGARSGDTILIRLQVVDALSVNAQIDVDTTAEGTNGWEDQWVTSMTIGQVRR